MNHSVVRHCRAAATSFVLAAAAFAAAAPAAADALVDRSYPVLPLIQETYLMSVDPDYDSNPNAPWRLGVPRDPPLPSFEDWFRGYTAERGVSWPEGSSLAYSPLLGRIDLRNTETNHALFRDIVARWQPQQIRVRFQFASAAPAAFRELGLEDVLGDSLSPEEWAALRARLAAHPGVELRDCPTILARRGTIDTAKGVSEVIYPTEFDVEPFRGDDGKTGVRVEPQDYQTREVGTIVQVTPNISSTEQWLSLDLTPVAVFPPSWRDFAGPDSPAAGAFVQPFFPVFSLATSVDLRDGRTLVFGGAVVDEPDKGSRVQLLFVSAERVLLDGSPLPLARPVEEPPPLGLETRHFAILPAAGELALCVGADAASATNVTLCLRELAGHAGVDWPEGSFLRFDQIDWTVVVRNTPENLDRFRRALLRARIVPFQLRVRTRFLSATPEAFESLSLHERLGGSFSPDDWAALRAKLDATPGVETRAWPTLLTRPGSSATIKGVTETIYPAEFEIEPFFLGDGTNAAPNVDWSVATAVPVNFQMREVGQIVQLTPLVSSEGDRITVDLTQSLVLPPVWKDYAAPAAGVGSMEQPFFPVSHLSAPFDLTPGYTALLCGTRTDDFAAVASPRYELFAIGVDLVGLDGEPIEHPATP